MHTYQNFDAGHHTLNIFFSFCLSCLLSKITDWSLHISTVQCMKNKCRPYYFNVHHLAQVKRTVSIYIYIYGFYQSHSKALLSMKKLFPLECLPLSSPSLSPQQRGAIRRHLSTTSSNGRAFEDRTIGVIKPGLTASLWKKENNILTP